MTTFADKFSPYRKPEPIRSTVQCGIPSCLACYPENDAPKSLEEENQELKNRIIQLEDDLVREHNEYAALLLERNDTIKRLEAQIKRMAENYLDLSKILPAPTTIKINGRIVDVKSNATISPGSKDEG